MESLADARLPDLVNALADRIDDTLIDLPRQYRSSLDMATYVIHDEARARGISFADAARSLLARQP